MKCRCEHSFSIWANVFTYRHSKEPSKCGWNVLMGRRRNTFNIIHKKLLNTTGWICYCAGAITLSLLNSWKIHMHLQIHLVPLAGIFILHIRNVSQCLLGSFYLFIILFTWQFQTFVTSQIFSPAIDVQEMAPASKGRCNKIANISDIVSSKLKKSKEKADIGVYCTWKSLCKHLQQFILSNLIMMLRVFVKYSFNWLVWHYFIFFSFLTTNVSSRRLDSFF